MTQLEAQLEGLAMGLEQRGEKSAAHAIRLGLKELQSRPKSLFGDIRDFHEKFGLSYSGPPRDLDTDMQIFRTKFIAEELCEYVDLPDDVRKFFQDAIAAHIAHHGTAPPEKALDALVDMAYVILGTAYIAGWDFDEAWRRVHAANMAKVRARRDGSDSARGSGYDVVKPEGWQAPDLSDLVRS